MRPSRPARRSGLHLLVNNTGINPAYGPMLDSDVDVARKVLEVNVVAAFSGSRRRRRWLGDAAHPGAIVNLPRSPATAPRG